MDGRNNGLFGQNVLDAMSFVSFMIGVANYSENLDQTKAQEMLNDVMSEVHKHLKEQDDKMDRILELMEGGKNNA